MEVKKLAFEEFDVEGTGRVINTVRHYMDGKIKARMQLALGSKCFYVSISIYEGIRNNKCAYGKQIGEQYAILTLNGERIKNNFYNEHYKTFPFEQNKIDKKYMPWVLSAIEFFKEIHPELEL